MDKNAVIQEVAYAVSISYFLRMEWQEGDRILIGFLHLCFSSLVTGNTEQFDNLGEKDLRKKIL